MDQWMCFLEFSISVNEDFSNYDDQGAWPTIIDEYVAFAKVKDA